MDQLSDDEIMGLNLPTGIPFVYELDENMKPIVSMQFLGEILILFYGVKLLYDIKDCSVVSTSMIVFISLPNLCHYVFYVYSKKTLVYGKKRFSVKMS